MADQTYIHSGFAGLATAKALRDSAVATGWIGARVRMEVNPKSLAERWKG